MDVANLVTARLVLDRPIAADRDRVVEYCRDPLFENFMVLPWPYEPRHADFFLDDIVPTGWARETEFTWAIRETRGGPLMGSIGWRADSGDIGYWLGGPHRGNGYMTEAVCGVTDWLFATLGLDVIRWECVPGNFASVAVARGAGFTYTGEEPSALVHRRGGHPPAWHAELAAGAPHTPTDGWPTP